MTAPTVARKRVLLVDDEPLVCEAVKMMLGFDGHEVETAKSAAEALDMFGQREFDVVITDYSMPGMRGDELAARLRSARPGQPIIMITAFAERLAMPLPNVDRLISKPFLLENLREGIAAVTNGCEKSGQKA